MKHTGIFAIVAMLALPLAVRAAEEEGFKPIFDGKTLEGWDGNPDFWRVEDGAIVGQTTAAKPTKGNKAQSGAIMKKGFLTASGFFSSKAP